MENKVCKRCNMNLPLSEYYKPKNGLYYKSKCRECYKEEYKATKGNEVAERKRLKRVMLEEKGVKICLTCNIELPLSSYEFNMGKYYSSDCKSCLSAKEKEKNLKKRMESGYVNKHELAIQSGVKICSKCKLELPLTDYYKKGKNGLEYICKICKSEKGKVYKKEYLSNPINKQKMRENSKRYDKKKALENRLKKEKLKEEALLLLNIEKERKRIENEKIAQMKELAREEKNRVIAYKKTDEYKIEQKNKDKVRRYNKWKNKWANDELFAIKVRLRNLVRNSFRKSGYNKFEMKTEAIVGINYEEFKQYMESKFQVGMTWDNRGDWHIDHIIPLSSAKSEEELIALSHYTNLQPLWAIDNLKKGARIDLI